VQEGHQSRTAITWTGVKVILSASDGVLSLAGQKKSAGLEPQGGCPRGHPRCSAELGYRALPAIDAALQQ
jgi:hypothetical protein